MNAAFTFDTSEFYVDLDTLPIGTYNLRLRAIDNNSIFLLIINVYKWLKFIYNAYLNFLKFGSEFSNQILKFPNIKNVPQLIKVQDN